MGEILLWARPCARACGLLQAEGLAPPLVASRIGCGNLTRQLSQLIQGLFRMAPRALSIDDHDEGEGEEANEEGQEVLRSRGAWGRACGE